MRADTVTKLSLYRFAQIMGVNPVNFGGIEAPLNANTSAPVGCGHAWAQHDWQNSQAVSRERMAQEIANAEEQLERYLGYRLMPTWEVDERHRTADPNKPELVHIDTFQRTGVPKSIEATWGWFVTGGVKNTTLVSGELAIVYSVNTATGQRTGTVTFVLPTTVSSETLDELQLFYPGKAGAPEWWIRPTTVSLTGTTVTMTFPRECALLEDVQESYFWPDGGVQYGDDASFLTTVDVYRVFNDPQTQTTLMWEPTSSCACVGSTTCVICQLTVQTGCLHGRDDRLGFLAYAAGTWNATDEDFDTARLAVARNPEIVRLWYRAGYRDLTRSFPDTVMSPKFERTVAMLAAAKLNRNPCDCTADYFELYRTDYMLEQSNGQSITRYRIPRATLSQALEQFGEGTMGAVLAMQTVQEPGLRLGTQISARAM